MRAFLFYNCDKTSGIGNAIIEGSSGPIGVDEIRQYNQRVLNELPPGEDVEVKFERIVPFTQLIEYQQYGPFDAPSNERGLDLSTMQSIQVSNAFDRLIIGSGGVSRDFINLMRQSILNARERLNQNPKHPKGPRVSVEDVNEASGSYGAFKKE